MADVDSDEDLTKELQPLAYHVSDKKRVLREALKALKGKRLDAMIPPVLKVWNREKLEWSCLQILDDVDDETLLSILDGRAGTAGVAAVEQVPNTIVVPAVKLKNHKLKKLAKIAVQESNAMSEPKKKKKKKAIDGQDDVKIAKLKKKKKLAKAKVKEKLKKKKKSAAASEDASASAAAPHKSLMELLELEYRAKAIKALLRSQGQKVPDIPLNLEEDDSNSDEPNSGELCSKQDEHQENLPQVNGESEVSVPVLLTSKTPPATNSKGAKSAKRKNKNRGKQRQTDSGETISSSKLPPKPNVKSSENASAAADEGSNTKKAVIDLIDEAFSSSFSEEPEPASVVNHETLKPLSVIVEACARNDVDSEALRLKLLQKYKKAKQRKKKKKPEPELKEQEDILELHPQELSLTDEDQTGNQNSPSATDEESDEYSEPESEELPIIPKSNAQSSQIANDTLKNVVKDAEMEELLYDDEGSEDGDDPSQNTHLSTLETVEKILTPSDMDENSCISNDKLQTSELDKDPGVESDNEPVISEAETTKDDLLSENSRSGIISETTRDDVFEGVSEGSAFTQNPSLKRKITFRIDPARLGALEEQAAEEETKRVEERKREEEEREKENEVEEGEIDSNDEGMSSEEKPKSPEAHRGLKRPKEEDNPGPDRRKRIKSDSNDSRSNSPCYSRRRSYKKAAVKNRDFGTYSPKRSENSPNRSRRESPRKTASPVEFITQFSDMEPISDDSDNSVSFTLKKKKEVAEVPDDLPVHSCAEMPKSFGKPKAIAANVSSSSDDDVETKTAAANDPKDKEIESGGDEDDDMPKPETWYERWAKSHGMQKVVQTNKIHKKVRTKLKQVVSDKKKPIEVPKDEPSIESEPIIGSIEEYEKLFGKKIKESDKHDVEASNDEDKAVNDIIENNDEDDEDDLWGDIIGGS